MKIREIESIDCLLIGFTPQVLGSTVNLRTARGCAYRCSFCGYPVRAGKYTFTEVETVEKELKLLEEVGTVTD